MRRKSERNKGNAAAAQQEQATPPAAATPAARPRRGRPRRKKSPTPTPSPSPSPTPESSPEREVVKKVRGEEPPQKAKPQPADAGQPREQAQAPPETASEAPTPVSGSGSPHTRTPTPEECDQMWHVKTSQSSSDTGEIQKLKICLSRPPSTPETPRRKSERISTDVKESPEEAEPSSRRSRRRSRRNSAKEASNSDLSVSEVESEPVSERESRSKSVSDPVPVVAPLKITQDKCVAVPVPIQAVESVERPIGEDVVKLTAVREVAEVSLVKENAKPSPVKEDVKPSPVKDIVKSSPVKDVAKSSPVKEVAKSSPITEVAKSSLVKGDVKSSAVKEDPKSSPIKENLKITPVKENVKLAPVEEVVDKPTTLEKPPVEIVSPVKASKTAPISDVSANKIESRPPKPTPDADEKVISSSESSETSKIGTEKKIMSTVISEAPKIPISKKSVADEKRISTTEIPAESVNRSDEKKVTTTDVHSTREVVSDEVPKPLKKTEVDRLKQSTLKESAKEKTPKSEEAASVPMEKVSQTLSDKKSVKNIAFADSTVSNISESPTIPQVNDDSNVDNDKREKINKSEKMDTVPIEKSNKDQDVVKKRDFNVRKVSVDNEANGVSSESDKTSATLTSDSSNQISRKRRWGSRSSKVSKSPAINISTDSLKNLIPMVDPVSVEDILPETKDVSRDSPETSNKRIRKDSEKFNGKFVINNDEISVEKDTPLGTTTHRKISIVSDDDNSKLLKSPSPPKHHSTSILFITNLVRPYTLPQLKNLLQRTGKIVENGFWIDKIKSRCYVEYETEDEAIETRHALHGVTWPVSNPKTLNVDFGSKEEMDVAMADNGEKLGPSQDLWLKDSYNSDLKGNLDKSVDRRITVREWDLGKDENKDGRFEKQSLRPSDQVDLDRKRRKSKSRSPSPARKFKKKEEEAPSKLLDDLFKKTKTTPCIYWLPLNAETILIKEEQRRKHMAEHERRMEEIKKMAEKRSSGHPPRHSTSNRHR